MPFLRGQQVNSGCPISLIEDASYHNPAYVDHESSSDLYTIKEDILHPPNRTYEHDNPMQDMLPILVLPEMTTVNISSSAVSNGKGFSKSVSFKDEEKTVAKNEGQIVVVCNQMETRADVLMSVTQQETSEDSAEKEDMRMCPNTFVRPRDEYRVTHATEDYDNDDDNNPYKNMASVIYSSEDEDMADNEPNDLRHYYKHGKKQISVERMKAAELQMEDSDESQA